LINWRPFPSTTTSPSRVAWVGEPANGEPL